MDHERAEDPADPAIDQGRPGIETTFLGHSTVLVRLGGVVVLTDPVLRGSVAGVVRRMAPPVDPSGVGPAEIVLISHAHHDHLDLHTLRHLPPGYTLVVPRGVGRYVGDVGAGRVVQLSEGDEVEVLGLQVAAVRAIHEGRRHPFGPPAEALGFVVSSVDQSVYHAGDTALYPEMVHLAERSIDVALLPVWGWGPRLGPGHLDPETAAVAAALIRPGVAVPVHWGTLWSRLVRHTHHRRTQPPYEFVDAVAQISPEITATVLGIGETRVLGTVAGPSTA